MNDVTTDGLIEGYLARLDAAASVLPSDRRAELLEEIRAHIDEAMAATSPLDEASVRNVLDRLGSPEEIVQASVARPIGSSAGVERPQRGIGMEVTAVVMLLIGGIVIPVIGWFVGLVLLVTSPRWTFADKLLGMLVWPFGLLPFFVLVFFAGPTKGEACVGQPVEVTSDGLPVRPPGGCDSSGDQEFVDVLTMVGSAVALVAQLGVAVYLIVRARRRAMGAAS